jgi:hypothetical protein
MRELPITESPETHIDEPALPWSHPGNRGFLRALAGLGRAAGIIGEAGEEARCAEFLVQLAPDAPRDITTQ